MQYFMLVFIFLHLVLSAKKKDRCTKKCPQFFYGNSTLINKCNDHCKKLGKSKSGDEAALNHIYIQCTDYCNVLYRYSSKGYNKCEKKCEAIQKL